MLEQLDEVDWAAFSHAYGSAEDVPAMICALRSKIALSLADLGTVSQTCQVRRSPSRNSRSGIRPSRA